VNPDEIARRIAARRSAGAELRARSPRSVWESIAAILDDWRRPDSPWRRSLEAELPAATGFSAPVVAEGLRIGLESWTGERLLEWVERELTPPDTAEAGGAVTLSGFPLTAVFLAGSIPMPSLLALLAPLALRSPVVAKSASRDPVTPRILAESVRAQDASLGRCIDVFDFAGSETDHSDRLLDAECVVVTGSDETVAEIRARVRPPRRVVTYGHRASAAVLDSAELNGDRLDDLARRLARDVALWDQLGCLSPLAAVVVGKDAGADAFAEALAHALAEIEGPLPRGAVDKAAAARIAFERSDAEMRRAAGRRVSVHTGAESGFTVIREDEPTLRPAPGHRFIRVAPVADEADAIDALRPLGPQLAAVGMAGFGPDSKLLARHFAALGASRVCALGRMQAPPLTWHHDNRGVFEPIARFADLEPVD